jgi:hypothetical protein
MRRLLHLSTGLVLVGVSNLAGAEQITAEPDIAADLESVPAAMQQPEEFTADPDFTSRRGSVFAFMPPGDEFTIEPNLAGHQGRRPATVGALSEGDLDRVGHQDTQAAADHYDPDVPRSYTFNWSDFPLKLRLGQTLTYNDNVLGLAHGQPTPFKFSRGDLYSLTSFGASSKLYFDAQQFFFDGNYGLLRYKKDTSLNNSQYSFDGGVNWNLTSRCSGRLVAAANKYQTPIEEQVGAGVNTVRTESANETAKCRLTANVSAILDSGWSSTRNSQVVSSANNNTAAFVRGGLEYAATHVDTFQVLATFTDRRFTERSGPVTATAGLANQVDQADYLIRYERLFSAKLTFDGSVGLSEITPSSSVSAVPTSARTVPVYSASLLWNATPKLSFGLAAARSVGSPTSVIANAEILDSRSLTVDYLFSPKLSFQAGLAQSNSNASSVGGVNTRIGVINQLTVQNNQRSISTFVKAFYRMTPFLSVTASYRYADRKSGASDTTANIFLIGLNYSPY